MHNFRSAVFALLSLNGIFFENADFYRSPKGEISPKKVFSFFQKEALFLECKGVFRAFAPEQRERFLIHTVPSLCFQHYSTMLE